MRTWVIYALSDPRTAVVRYIGVTFRPKVRLNEHLSRARKGGRTHRDYWIRSLLSRGLAPEICTIDTGTGDWRAAERRWIAHHRVTLVNHTDGGEGTPGYVPTPELLAKWSEMRRGRKYSPGRIPPMLGKTHGSEARSRIARASTGRVQTAEARAKVGAARRGKPLSELHKTKLAAAKLGRTHTLEHNAKTAVSTKNRKPVVCAETGEMFASITAAAKALGVTEASVNQAIRKGFRCRGKRLRLA